MRDRARMGTYISYQGQSVVIRTVIVIRKSLLTSGCIRNLYYFYYKSDSSQSKASVSILIHAHCEAYSIGACRVKLKLKTDTIPENGGVRAQPALPLLRVSLCYLFWLLLFSKQQQQQQHNNNISDAWWACYPCSFTSKRSSFPPRPSKHSQPCRPSTAKGQLSCYFSCSEILSEFPALRISFYWVQIRNPLREQRLLL